VLPDTFSVTCHTDYVGRGSTFVAIPGTRLDGTRFVAHAIEKGARRIVVQNSADLSRDAREAIVRAGVRLQEACDCRVALAQLSAAATDHAHRKLRIIGITGTKGKTTTAYLLEQILRGCGLRVALLSTVAKRIDGKEVAGSRLTTPPADWLHQFFAQSVAVGIDYVVMEVAAQAVTQHRVAGIEFDGLIFTNLALEHLEFYQSMEEYFTAKAALFSRAKAEAPLLINSDDEWGRRLLAHHPRAIDIGRSVVSINGNRCDVVDVGCLWDGAQKRFVCPSLCGYFNGVNLYGALCMARALGLNANNVAGALEKFPGIPGRLQRHQLPNGAVGIIDYAHNPLSFEAVLSTLRPMTRQLIVVFGAGGDRDPSRRAQMGNIAARYADHIVLTSDNPRTEDPAAIIEDIFTGMSETDRSKVSRELDREAAIRYAYRLSCNGAILALLSKGPDEYQIVGDRVTRFSEREILESLA